MYEKKISNFCFAAMFVSSIGTNAARCHLGNG